MSRRKPQRSSQKPGTQYSYNKLTYYSYHDKESERERETIRSRIVPYDLREGKSFVELLPSLLPSLSLSLSLLLKWITKDVKWKPTPELQLHTYNPAISTYNRAIHQINPTYFTLSLSPLFPLSKFKTTVPVNLFGNKLSNMDSTILSRFIPFSSECIIIIIMIMTTTSSILSSSSFDHNYIR